MGIWSEQVTPRLVNLSGSNEQILEYRRRACAGLHGEVVELGFGSGLNLSAYPPEVTRVIAIEPSDVGWRMSADARAGSAIPVVRGGLDGARLSLPDASVDGALSTFTLCTIPDVEAALREVTRVLRPGGALHFFEHGIAPEEGVQRWQHRLEPLQKRLFDGCHLTRPIDEIVARSGLVIERLEKEYAPGPRFMRPWVYGYLGWAVKPG